MRRYEMWEAEYRRRPYLRFATMEQLEERTFHIVNNIRTLTPDNKIGALPFDQGGQFWASRMSHLMEEVRRRGCGLPAISKYAEELKGLTAPIPKVESRLAAREIPVDRCFLKYSRREYNEESYATGRVRIGSASSYDNDALARAIRDRELERVVYLSDESFTISSDPREVPRRLAQSKRKSTTDYFLYSLAQAHERRLFHDFRANSCMLIYDIDTFLSRILRAFFDQYPSFIVAARTISYYDPFDADTAHLDVQFCKPFEYGYQKEFRIAWLPPNRIENLQPFFVEIGSLKDVAELIQ